MLVGTKHSSRGQASDKSEENCDLTADSGTTNTPSPRPRGGV